MPPGARALPDRVDLVVGAGFAVAWAVEAGVRDGGHPLRLALDLAGVPALALLAVRRTRPLLTMTVLSAGFCLASLLERELRVPTTNVVVPILGLLLATYSLGAHASWRGLALGAWQPVLTVAVVDVTAQGPPAQSLGSALSFFALFVAALPVLAGRLVWSRGRLVARLREQQRLLAAERAAATEAALAAERLELTGRLHQTLLTGMDALVDDVAAAGAAGAAGLDAVTAVERRARELLGRTREVVVSLSGDGGVSAPSPITGTDTPTTSGPWGLQLHDRGQTSLPWTATASSLMAVGLLLEVQHHALRVPGPVAVLACLLVAAPTALTPRAPLAATVATWAAATVFGAAVLPWAELFTGIALSFVPPFLVGALSGRPRALAGLGVCCAGEVAAFGPAAALGNLPLVLAAWLAGVALGERGRLVADLRTTTAQLAAERQAAPRRAVAAERARVARDLHDSVGHRLTVLAFHAAAARRLWTSDKERAEAALAVLGSVVQSARAELRQGVALPGGTTRASPDALDDLVAGARAAGLPVELRFHTAAEGSPDVGEAAYRVVQEALTNVLWHAPGAPTTVTVGGGAATVVEVRNGAPTGPGAGGGAGSGLAGLRRRVEACSGAFTCGPEPGGGFLVRAEFPSARVPA